MTMRTLYCEAGDHNWERPSQRGRTPRNCPEHTEVKTTGSGLSGLDKARQIKAQKRAHEEKAWDQRIEEVINDPRMQVTNPDPYSVDARRDTPRKLRYIQQQLKSNKANRSQNDIAELEKMREKIMKNPFSSTGHLL